MSFLIRRPEDQSSLSTPLGLSQTATSFIACNRQGIHHIHLVTWSYNPTAYCPVRSQVTYNVVRCFSNFTLVLKNSFLSLNAITTRFQSIHIKVSSTSMLHLDRNASFTKFLKNNWLFWSRVRHYSKLFSFCHLKTLIFLMNAFKSQKELVELNGIEPMTSCLQSRRSTNWATAPV